ncbi:unnamed protein product [Spirodela intermedia]|uniref:Uncharacterized protein n=1 Tax=Spirodela intermedia TaxID=51605 RepID=A0A7I8JR43_SPIIN|nr:unnamed protein product [Spirodela intermedia]CAA6671912.1 unnamed protein product [Spirodela intermedia]
MVIKAVGCLLILILDVVAGVLGIEAQISQNKGKHVKVLFFECKEPSHEAYRLGLAAAALLGVAHVVANLLGGCNCICSKEEMGRSSAGRKLASGLSSSHGNLRRRFFLPDDRLPGGLLPAAHWAMSNSKSRATCGLAHHNFLSVGGILCFVHALFCMVYCGLAAAAHWEDKRMRRKEAAAHTNREEAPRVGDGHPVAIQS